MYAPDPSPRRTSRTRRLLAIVTFSLVATAVVGTSVASAAPSPDPSLATSTSTVNAWGSKCCPMQQLGVRWT